jgi:hypothetical protein
MKLEKELSLQKYLVEAIVNNNFPKVKKLINQGINVNFKHHSLDRYTQEPFLESTFIKALCCSNSKILDFLFSKGLRITNEDNIKQCLPFIQDRHCLMLAMNHGLTLDEIDVEKLINFRAPLAAIACLNGVNINKKACDILMSKLLYEKEYPLMNNLLTLGFTLHHSIENHVPEMVRTHALALKEKSLLENTLNQSSVIHVSRMKI